MPAARNQLTYRESDFVADGALRDISVLDTELTHWQRMFDALADVPGEHSFQCDADVGQSAPGKLSAEALFAELDFDGDISARLDINIQDVWFACYFFDVEEIEFTFDPVDITSTQDFHAVEKFMVWLGEACRKPVIMTMEGTDHHTMPALLRYDPTEA